LPLPLHSSMSKQVSTVKNDSVGGGAKKQVSTVKNDSVGGGADGDCCDDALSMVNDRIAHAADGNDAEDAEEELEALRAIFGDVRVTAPDSHGEQTWWVPLGEGRVFSVTIPDGCVDSHASVGNTKKNLICV
jgi:hypothetical protein